MLRPHISLVRVALFAVGIAYMSPIGFPLAWRPLLNSVRAVDMEPPLNTVDVEAFLHAVLVLLKNVADSLVETEDSLPSSDDNSHPVPRVIRVHDVLVDMHVVIASVLHDFRLAHSRRILDDELGFWVLSRSTAWFSHFLLHEYDDQRWVANFRFTKAAIFQMASVLAPHCQRQDTRYQKAIPMRVKIACVLYKLVQGASLLMCSELFAVGQSIVSMYLRDVVYAINLEFRAEISFPRGQRLRNNMHAFHEFCGLLGVVGAIDGTHIHIRKPYVGPEDYFYFKSLGYSIHMQAIVDRSKRFVDLSVGMPGSTHDSRVLRRSALYQQAESGTLFDEGINVNGFMPYLLGDSGYPLKQ